MMRADRPPLKLRRYFSGLAEYVFHAKLGLADPPLVEYLSGLMSRFVRVDALFSVRDAEGRPLQEVTEMVQRAEDSEDRMRREIHRHIGDFTLFWVGVYPEALRKFRRKERKDYFVDYCAQGKRAYRVASAIATDDEPPGEVLERLSVQYELCASGLGQVRRLWEDDAASGDAPPMRIN